MTRTIEAVRKDLRKRIAEPSKFDTPPPFMGDIPEGDVTASEAVLWHEAEQRWLDYQAASGRRWRASLERKSAWMIGLAGLVFAPTLILPLRSTD